MKLHLRHHRDKILQLLERVDNFDFIEAENESLLDNTEGQVNRPV